MKIILLAVGSRGDVQPYTALALGLERAGHRVRLVTHPEFERFVVQRGLEFAPIHGNPREMLETETGKAWLDSGRNPFAFVTHLSRLFEPMMERFQMDAWEACQGAEAILYSTMGTVGFHIAEKLRIPCAAVLLQPASRTRAFPSLLTPTSASLGGPLNWLSHLALEQLFWQPFRAHVNRWRTEVLGLPPVPLIGPYARLYRERVPILYGFSPTVVPPPADWPAWHVVTGYWFLDHPPEWQPPADLVDFLADGPPPVYIGFGSMTSRDAAALTELALQALQRAEQRGVLLSGWSGLGQGELPGHVYAMREIPHDWLFPRMAAVVHHGGAGTTAAGLRAGVPSILTPFFGDQPFWAQRVFHLGVGPRPIPHRRLRVDSLAAAIRLASSDEAMRDRAAALGQRIRAEDGVARAVEAFEKLLR